MQGGENSRIGDFLAAWVGLAGKHALAVVAMMFVVTALLLNYTINNLGVNTDTTDMIAENLDWRQRFIEFRETFPGQVRNLIIVIESETPELVDRTRSVLVRELELQPDTFYDVYTPGSGEFFARNGLLFLSIEELERMADDLAAGQPFMARLAADPSAAALFTMISDASKAKQDSTVDFNVAPVLQGIAKGFNAAGKNYYRMSWRRFLAGDQVTPEIYRQFIITRPKENFRGLAPGREAMDAVRDAAAKIEMVSAGAVKISMTGQVALATEELRSVTQGMGIALVLSLIMVAATLYAALRSYRLVLASVVTLIMGLVGTAAFATFAVGSLNLISIAFAVLYIGLGVDFAIHLSLRYRELIIEGQPHAEAMRLAASDVGSSLLFCAVTTSVGFYAFFPTTFRGVAELGLISGTGMYISLLASLTVLPALISLSPLSDKRIAKFTSAGVLVKRVAEFPHRRGRLVRILALIVTISALMATPFLRFDNNPVNLRDPDTESVKTFKRLMTESEAPPLSATVIAGSPAKAEKLYADFSELEVVTRVVSIGSFVPDDQEEKLGIIEDINFLLGPDLTRPSGTTLATPLDFGAIDALYDSLSVFLESDQIAERKAAQSLKTAIESLRARASNSGNQAALLDNLDKVLVGVLPDTLDALREALQADTVTNDSLPGDLKSRWVANDGRTRVEIFPRYDIMNEDKSREFVTAVQTIDATATGLPVIHQQAGDAVLQAFLQAFTYAIIVVSGLLFLVMRSIRDVFLVLAPLFVAGLATGFVMVIFGVPFNFANIIALPLLLGIGVDNGIHMVHRARVAPPSTGNLLETSTARGVVFSALTTIFSFGNLAFSRHVGTASMGLLLTIGMVLTVIATLIILPAMIRVKATR